MIYDVMASNLSALHSMVRHKLTLSPICWVWVEEGLDCWDTFNLLVVGRGPYIYAMGNTFKCVVVSV